MRCQAPPPPLVDEPLSDRLVLRDGSVVRLRLTETADAAEMRRFFHGLSPESRYKRFFTAGEPGDDVIARLCDSSDPAGGLTLVAVRSVSGDDRFVASGSYLRLSDSVAEVGFAVDDALQGKGVATGMLERLATLASAAGFARFQATTLADNSAMLEVFRDSGFQIRSKTSAGCVELELSLAPSTQSLAATEKHERIATAASIGPLLQPRSVAVVGASRDESGVGRQILRALVKAQFAGPIYPVNPAVAELDGLKTYASARQLPRDVDLAVVAVPRDAVLGVVDDCAAAGVKSLVVISAGFADTGATGSALQHQLVDKVRGHGMRMVGPNCMGLLNADPAIRLNASFSPIFPSGGCVALSSQSGALGIAILALAKERGLGLSSFVSIGNKADVSGNDLLQYWENDPKTRTILLYLESFGNPRRFLRIARRISRTKPLVAVKAGKTAAGSRAAKSHTAALASDDAAVSALLHQAGVIRADTIDEMFDIAACLDTQPLPSGRRVAIVTNAGGPGILAVDACEAAGLAVAELSAETRERLAGFLPAAASTGNPVDMVASAGAASYGKAIEALLTAREVDALIIIYVPIDTIQYPAILSAIGDGIAVGRRGGAPKKPILACVMTEPGRHAPLVVDDERIPAYSFPENAVRALAKVANYAGWRAAPPGLFWSFDDVHADEARALCRAIVEARGDDWLTPEEMRRVLCAFGLPLAHGVVAKSGDEAAALAGVIGFPVAAKVVARGLIHKTEAGAVRLNLQNEQATRKAYADLIAQARRHAAVDTIDGVLIQPMIVGTELLVGVSHDPSFGPMVGFGLGGINVEVLGDVHFRIAPLTDRDVDELLHEIRGFPLLDGYRGRPPADVEAVRELLLRVSRLAYEIPEILELDLNPVMALPAGNGCRVVDARVKVGRARSRSTSVW